MAHGADYRSVMNSMKDMDYRLNTLRVCYLIFISVLALYGHIRLTPFSAKWGLATVIMVFCTVVLWVLSISIKTKNKIIMTRKETEDRIKVMQAYLDGKDVRSMVNGGVIVWLFRMEALKNSSEDTCLFTMNQLNL